MLQALINGKLSRSIENLEDVLTSSVFGTLQLTVSPENGLFPWLREARDLSGSMPLGAIFDSLHCAAVRYEFWPRWHYSCGYCEPDLVLWVSDNEQDRVTILIEAKLWSGKSSFASDEPDVPPSDQLARQWLNLGSRSSGEPYLIYLTADYGFPDTELEETLSELNAKGVACDPTRLLWLSWRTIPATFRSHPSPALQEIVRLAERLDLSFFSGFKGTSVVPVVWSIDTSNGSSGADDAGITSDENSADTEWKCEAIPRITWRFLG